MNRSINDLVKSFLATILLQRNVIYSVYSNYDVFWQYFFMRLSASVSVYCINKQTPQTLEKEYGLPKFIPELQRITALWMNGDASKTHSKNAPKQLQTEWQKQIHHRIYRCSIPFPLTHVDQRWYITYRITYILNNL